MSERHRVITEPFSDGKTFRNTSPQKFGACLRCATAAWVSLNGRKYPAAGLGVPQWFATLERAEAKAVLLRSEKWPPKFGGGPRYTSVEVRPAFPLSLKEQPLGEEK